MKKIVIVFTILSSLLFPINYQYNGGNYDIDDNKIEKAFVTGIDNSVQDYGNKINEEELKLLIFDSIIEQELLLNSSFGKKIVIPKKDIEEQFDLIRSSFPDDISFFKVLENQGFTMATLKKELENNLKLEKIKIAIESEVKITEEEVKAYYNENVYNSYFINKSYEEVKNEIKESILEKKNTETLSYFIESEKEKIIPQKNSSYSKYFSKVVYEKDGFKFTNVDLANRKIMYRIQGLSDEELLMEMAKEAIDKELKIVYEAKKRKLKIPENFAKEDKISAYREIYQKNLIATTVVSEKELKEYFEENSDRYFIPESYNIKLIELAINPSDLDKIESKRKAEEILKLALDGNSFSDLAKQYSDDSSAESGGELGWFSRGQMVQSFEDEVFKGEVGEVIPYLVETEFGHHIIKVEDKKSDDSEVNASHILIMPKISDTTIQETTKTVAELIEQIKTRNTTFEEVAKEFSIIPDAYDFKNVRKGEYIPGIGTSPLLDEALSSSKLNELSYVVGDRAFIFIKTKHNNEIEATFENSLERVKYDLVREKVEGIINEMLQ